jgi:hypothetical protein
MLTPSASECKSSLILDKTAENTDIWGKKAYFSLFFLNYLDELFAKSHRNTNFAPNKL